MVRIVFAWWTAVLLVSCSQDAPELPDVSPPALKSLFGDTLYRHGFTLGHVVDGTPGVAGLLSYGGTTRDNPVWSIAQWNNYNNNLKDAAFTASPPRYEYTTEGGTSVVVDTDKGSILLKLNTGSEYGHSPVCPVNPRRAGDKWPHLLLGYDWAQADVLPLRGLQEVWMDIGFTVEEVTDKMPPGTGDPTLHAAQFQWFITVQNRTVQDDGYGEYLWFGLSYYDNRHDFSPFYAAKDANTTGAFIYLPDMKEFLSTSVTVGEKKQVAADILPHIKKAFELAKNRGFMQKTEWDDLHIGSTNIGWEVPGTYNVAVLIDNFAIRYR